MNIRIAVAAIVLVSIGTWPSHAAQSALDANVYHLRSGTQREWSDFSEEAYASSVTVRFQSARNAANATLRLRQQDVKQVWNVLLNGELLGRLVQDENDQLSYYTVLPGRLQDGENIIVVEPTSQFDDDIRVGELALIDRPVGEVLNESRVEVSVIDTTDADRSVACPSRITIVSSQNSLVPVGAVSGKDIAVRAGVIYAGNGRATFGLPAGEYTIYAGRGFEYGVASQRISTRPGDVIRSTLEIRREVPTPGYLSMDTHIHTLTYSGHGDATLAERMLSIAGEGIELPVATEHNLQVDYGPAAEAAGVRQFCSPIVGNEVTTPVGHFNIFPVIAGAPVPTHDTTEGQVVLRSIAEKANSPFIILNHPCDLHRGYRPFDSVRHITPSGENDDAWLNEVNGVEVINSGAQQTDMLKPLADWFGMLNHGTILTPIGASDSHDVNRFIVGQARTYVRCPDEDAGCVDVGRVVESLRAGRVLVSCGLLTDITVDSRYGPGDLAPSSETLEAHVRVLGPSWATADQITLYANGIPLREARITDGHRPGIKWETTWTLPRFVHDAHLAAIAVGPPVDALYWPIARPYQPTSERSKRRVVGATGAVWIDGDADGKRTSARAYAEAVWIDSGRRVPDYVGRLQEYDEAVAIQAAALLVGHGVSLFDNDLQRAAQRFGQQVVRGFKTYAEAWRVSQQAKGSSP